MSRRTESFIAGIVVGVVLTLVIALIAGGYIGPSNEEHNVSIEETKELVTEVYLGLEGALTTLDSIQVKLDALVLE